MTPGLVYAAGTVIAWTGWVFAFRAVSLYSRLPSTHLEPIATDSSRDSAFGL